MEITYLGHSGFLVETSAAYLLFDYIRGNLPEFDKAKRLYVFASHAHSDHWDPVCAMADTIRFISQPKRMMLLKNTYGCGMTISRC